MIDLEASSSNKLSYVHFHTDSPPNLPPKLDVIILKASCTCAFQVYKGHSGVVRSVAVDPSGQWIASGTMCDKYLWLHVVYILTPELQNCTL